MLRFSANLGFLWSDLPLTERIERAAASGFDAVELHWPYDEDRDALASALGRHGLPLLGLNTRKGDRPGDFGLAALPGREDEARAAIDEAFDWAEALGAGAVHVMAGRGILDEGTKSTYAANLTYACDRAAAQGAKVLIEPINGRDVPDYALRTLDQAVTMIDKVQRSELAILFDCYHVQIEGGDLVRRFAAVRDKVGHVQFASVPERTEPDRGEIAYDRLLPEFEAMGWSGYLGAEYKPEASVEAGLGWLQAFRKER